MAKKPGWTLPQNQTEKIVTLVTVNFQSGKEVQFRDQNFSNYDDLMIFVERFYRDWSSLVVTVVAQR